MIMISISDPYFENTETVAIFVAYHGKVDYSLEGDHLTRLSSLGQPNCLSDMPQGHSRLIATSSQLECRPYLTIGWVSVVLLFLW